jgi:hypothetical protein
VYSVEWERHALDELSALPSEVFPFYAELVTVLQAVSLERQCLAGLSGLGACQRRRSVHDRQRPPVIPPRQPSASRSPQRARIGHRCHRARSG